MCLKQVSSTVLPVVSMLEYVRNVKLKSKDLEFLKHLLNFFEILFPLLCHVNVLHRTILFHTQFKPCLQIFLVKGE